MIDGTAVVLTHRPEEVNDAARALALYFHLYCGMEARDAAVAAGGALRCEAPALSFLESGVEEMAACGQGWLQRIILEWRYGGGRVEASGDVVGGWDQLVPLSFDVSHKKWRVQLWGHPPGPCAYKFIVDGSWCTDMSSPSQTDQWGNTNNWIYVPQCAQVGAAARAAGAADGMAAGLLPSRDGANSIGELVGGEMMSASPSSASSQEDMAWSEEVTPEERLRMARFGAGILGYYAKSHSMR